MAVDKAHPADEPQARLAKVSRDVVLQAALDLFGEAGFHSATLRDVGLRVGLPPPALLLQFPTKEALLVAVLGYRDKLALAAIEREITRGQSKLEAILRVSEELQANSAIAELFARFSIEATSPDHPAYAYFTRRYQAAILMLTEEFQRYADADLLRPGLTPDRIARTMTAVMDGLQNQMLMALSMSPDQHINIVADLRGYLTTVFTDRQR